MIYTEIPADLLNNVLQNAEMMAKCDVIALLYENDLDQANFLRDYISKLPELVPKILINTKPGFTGSQDALAKDLGGLRICKHIQSTLHDNRFQEVLNQVVRASLDPKTGLPQETIDIAKSRTEGSWLEDWFGLRSENVGDLSMTAATGIILTGVAALAIYQYRRNLRFK